MSGPRLGLWSAALIILAAILDAALAHRIMIAGVAPDFMLVVVCCLAVPSNRSAGSGIGFVGGIISGALAVPSALSAFAISRTLVGFLAGWSPRLFRPQILLAGITVTFLGTIVAETTYLLISPQPNVGSWVKLMVGRSLYNAVLAAPLYYLLIRSQKTDTQR